MRRTIIHESKVNAPVIYTVEYLYDGETPEDRARADIKTIFGMSAAFGWLTPNWENLEAGLKCEIQQAADLDAERFAEQLRNAWRKTRFVNGDCDEMP